MAYYIVSGLGHPPAARPAARAAPSAGRPVSRATPPPAPVVAPYARTVVIRLAATGDCWVEFTTPGGGYLFQAYVAGGTSKAWTFPTPWPCGWVIPAASA